MILIDDPDDPRVAAYRDVRERDLVGREGRFIAEGEVVLRRLLQSVRFTPVSVLLAQKRAEKLAPVVAAAGPETPVYVASQPVIDALAGFHLHRGVLALGRDQSELSAEALLSSLPSRGIALVLCGVGNHDNMGGLFRNAAAFGAAAVLLDFACCNPLYRKAIRVSVGAVLQTPFAVLNTTEDMIALLRRHAIEPIALSPAGAERLYDVRPAGKIALLVGAEGPGLAPDILRRCRTVRIPMAAGFDSLNVAAAAAVALHHLTNAPGG